MNGIKIRLPIGYLFVNVEEEMEIDDFLEIANQLKPFAKAQGTVSNLLGEKRKMKYLDFESKKKIIEMFDEGKNPGEIAKEMGLKYQTVANYQKKKIVGDKIVKKEKSNNMETEDSEQHSINR